MPSGIHLVHRTRGRMRLRVTDKRKDIPYFLALYENLRRIPSVTDVVINPDTGSILLHFPGESEAPILHALAGIGLLRADVEAQRRPGLLGRMEQFLAKGHRDATQVRSVLMVIMIALALYQVRRGVLIAPALTLVWYAYDMLTSQGKERALLDSTDRKPSAPSQA